MSSDTKSPKRLLRSIGSQLTALGAAGTFATCALLCIGLYFGLSLSLHREVDKFLEGEVHEFMQTVNHYPNDDAGLEKAIREELGSRTQRDLAFRFFDSGGELIVTSEADDQVGPLWAPPEDWSKTPPYFEFRTLWADGAPYPYRTCSLRVTTVDGRGGTAQAGYSLKQVNESLAMFRRICALGLCFAVCLSLVSGRLTARKTLGPIRALANRREGSARCRAPRSCTTISADG